MLDKLRGSLVTCFKLADSIGEGLVFERAASTAFLEFDIRGFLWGHVSAVGYMELAEYRWGEMLNE